MKHLALLTLILVANFTVLAEEKSDFNIVGEWCSEAPNGVKLLTFLKKMEIWIGLLSQKFLKEER